MAATAVEAAEDALRTAIAGRAGLAGVQVDLGDPGSNVLPEHIWIAESAPDEEQEWETTGVGSQQRRETFTIRVVVLVEQSGNDYQAIRDRARVLSAEIEEAVRANQTLAGAVFHAEVSADRRATGGTDEGRIVQREVLVRCMAFLA
ncbi:MAG: hypothetical protein ACRDHM_07440 [Actinomycetota bacterium]